MIAFKDWKEVHTDRNITVGTFIDKINKLNIKYKLPNDINSFSFNKFIQIYIKVIEVFFLIYLVKNFKKFLK